jgi:molecular chaperone GrpE (heat shock protein)
LKKLLQPIGGLTTFTPKAAANENVNAPRAANDERMPSSNGDPTTLFKLAGAVGSIGGSIIDKIRGKKTQEPQPHETVAQNNSQEKEGLFNKLSKKITSLTDKVKENETVKKAVEIGKDGKQYVNGLRKGSWQERLANMTNKNKEVIKDKNEVRKFAIKNIFSMLANMVGSVKKKLSDWVGSKKDPVELAGDIADGMGDTDKKETRKERKERKKREKRERSSRGKSRWFNKPSGLISTATRIGAGAYAANAAVDSVSNVMDGNYGDAAIDAGKAAVTGTYAAGGFSALAGGASKLAKGAFSKTALKALGAAGVAYGAYSAYDNFSQGNYGSAALDAALTIGGGALLIGKGGALAGAGAALLFNPVTWMVGAGALGVYLAYKGSRRELVEDRVAGFTEHRYNRHL